MIFMICVKNHDIYNSFTNYISSTVITNDAGDHERGDEKKSFCWFIADIL